MNKIILGFILVCSFINLTYASASGMDYPDMPRDVKSIAVNKDSITVNFDNLPSFQVVYTRNKEGEVIPFEYGTIFTISIGENIGWGDGDHYFASITLTKIINNKAYIILTSEHRPPATHINLSSTDRKEYVIDKRYVRKN